jgi:high-affinity iron transporter
MSIPRRGGADQCQFRGAAGRIDVTAPEASVSGALLGNYLIGLREGLEATLVVTILVAFLVKSGRRERLPQVWLGVGAAVALSVGFGAILTYVAEDLLGYQQKELFDAISSILAVVFVTWMIFWMRRFSRSLAKDLRGRLEEAIGLGTFAVVVMAFLAVAREGLETALLFYAAAQGATTSAGPVLGITLGVLSSVVLGFFLYAGAIRINLSVFFKWTGLALILVAAGIFKYGVHDLQESGVLPGITSYMFDLSGSYDVSTWYGALLTGMVNFTATPTWLEMIAWIAYLVPVLVLFLLPGRATPPPPAPAPAPVGAPSTSDSSESPAAPAPQP